MTSRPVNVRMQDDLLERLDSYCEKNGENRSEVVRRAVFGLLNIANYPQRSRPVNTPEMRGAFASFFGSVVEKPDA